jgi:arginine/lysine/ornithine decarboxylase
MVFTPTYYGVSSDVRGLADVAHAHDVPLITDDAWGLNYSFCSRLLDSPGANALDPMHLNIDVAGLGLTGFQAADWLHQKSSE